MTLCPGCGVDEDESCEPWCPELARKRLYGWNINAKGDITPRRHYTSGAGAMDWADFDSEADKRPALNHVGFRTHGFYIEEMLVHAEDGALLGKLITTYMLGRPGETRHVLASMEEVRGDRIKAMRNGTQP